MEIHNLIILPLMIAVTAFIYSDVLTEPGMLLNKVYRWLDYSDCSNKRRVPEIIFNPLIGCFRCVSGQMALWVFMWNNSSKYMTFCRQFNLYDLVNLIAFHIYFMSITIYLTWIISKVYRKLT